MTKNSNYQGLISVIISTYNWPDALNLVLHSLNDQTDNHFEVIITDDGSTEDTKQVIDQFKNKSKYPITHLWQEDEGFRLSRARNMGIIAAKGDYIIFIDGDCLVRPSFVDNHRILAEKNYFVTGNRVIISQKFSKIILDSKQLVHGKSLIFWLYKRLTEGINRWHTLLTFGLNSGRRYKNANKWRKARGCNMAYWHDDLYAVNGFEQELVGWGYDDSDIIIRLLNKGVKRKSGYFATTVFHLWHKETDRTNEQANLKKLQSLSAHDVKAKYGINELKQEL